MTSATHWIDDALWSHTLSYDLARQMVGQPLQFFWGDAQGQTCVETLQVRACEEQTIQPGLHQFTLELQGPSVPLLASQSYRARHETLGDFAIFISATARTTDGVAYQACFSHAV